MPETAREERFYESADVETVELETLEGKGKNSNRCNEAPIKIEESRSLPRVIDIYGLLPASRGRSE